MNCLSVEELALQAETDAEYVRRLIDLGVVEPAIGSESYGPADVRRVQLLAPWEAAGFSVEAAVDLVRAGEFSVSWLDAPAMTRAERSDVTYEQLCRDEGVPLSLVRALQAALGFPPPEPADRAWDGDRDLVDLVGTLLAAGASQAAALGLVRVYADSLSRVAKAEAELYESEIEQPLRRSGRSEQDIRDYGARFSDGMITSLERALVDIYRRHRERVWIEHCITHAELALERAGLWHRNPRPPAICFVDLTGYTRITRAAR